MLLLAFTGGIAFNVYAEQVTGVVKDDKGNPVEDAVLYAMPLSGGELPPPQSAIIDQIDKEFYPYVSAVQVGTAVSFPNNDEIRHHVYSFSPAKTFELPLYPPGKGLEQSVVFDQPGVVVLGCNIHDWMKAYVFVVETPFFAKTDNTGSASITNLGPGEYEVKRWHPRIQKSSEAQKLAVTIAQGSSEAVEFTIKLKKEWRVMRAPRASGGVYR
jgi:hypothetical protein